MNGATFTYKASPVWVDLVIRGIFK